jgi:type IV pilus assembly protein PilB
MLFRLRTSKKKPVFTDEVAGIEELNGLSNLYDPKEEPSRFVRDIADVLTELGKLTQTQLEQVRGRQQARPEADAAAIIEELNFAEPEDILMATANLYGYEFRRIPSETVDKEAFGKLDINYIKENSLMPIGIKDGQLLIATSRPADVFVIDDVKRRTGMGVHVIVCTDKDILNACQTLNETKLEYCVDQIIEDAASQGDIQVVKSKEEAAEDLERIAGESPIIKFVNYLISHAIREGASDIHIEPREEHTKIRYRIDGLLFDSMKPPASMHSAVVSRLKIMSNLDISERRVPQDGRISAIVGGREIDLRISTLPTSFGEKVVIRILDSRSILRSLEELGMSQDVLVKFRQEIERPHGIILVTGPTGSGKTTTLYSALSHMDGKTMNISTVEDPIEYHLDFTNQVQVNERIGLSFAAALRSLLRQDPDIIMLGEIRDSETARIAVQAALTGHLVLSTLHTNDAPSSVTRLVDIGIEPYLISASLNSILAQRLVRRICPKCKTQYKVPEDMLKSFAETGLSENELFHGSGCDACRNSGYQGRIGIYELLLVDEAFGDMIAKDCSITNMRAAFAASKQSSLYADGIAKVRAGLTTLEEVLRVTEAYAQDKAPSAQTELCINVPESFALKDEAGSGPIKIISAESDSNSKVDSETGISLETVEKVISAGRENTPQTSGEVFQIKELE